MCIRDSITTVAGSNLSGFDGDGGPATSAKLKQPADVALGPGGVLYIADYGNHRIRMVDASGTVSYTHLRAHETVLDPVCRLLLEKKKRRASYWTSSQR